MWRENKSGVGTDRRVEGEQVWVHGTDRCVEGEQIWGWYMVQTGVWRENKSGVGTDRRVEGEQVWGRYRQVCGGRTSLG